MPVTTAPKDGKGCGKCCWLRVVIEPEDDVPEGMTEKWEGSNGDVEVNMRRNPVDMYCIAFDRKTRLCRIYDRRPKMCRVFDCGNPLCVQAIYRTDKKLRPVDLPDLEFVTAEETARFEATLDLGQGVE